MWIDVKIPYEPNGKLAEAYNRAMKNTTAPWVLLLDHDVFLALNPHWYEMCLEVINKVEDDVGLITCVTNGNRGRAQDPGIAISKEPNLDIHVQIAKYLYYQHGTHLHPVTNKYIAGYFMLINWNVWRKIRFHNQGKGVNKIDQDFARRLLNERYKIMVMTGLYVYHHKKVRKLKWKT